MNPQPNVSRRFQTNISRQFRKDAPHRSQNRIFPTSLFLRMIVFSISLLVVWPMHLSAASAASETPSGRLPGFVKSPYWGEQLTSYTFNGDVSIVINAPSEEQLDIRKPTQIVLFTLPNGNTIDQTIGKKPSPGLDWHYGIQHIGAQTRRLREVVTDQNIIVAYLEARDKKIKRSWPTWMGNHPDRDKLIPEMIESVVQKVNLPNPEIALTCHSGGGSVWLGYIAGVDQIPDRIRRFAFLDANYNYSEQDKHAEKLIEWLKRSPDHNLIVVCYDDRNIRINGKLILGPTGGTYRKTQKMIARFQKDVELTTSTLEGYTECRDANKQVDFTILQNPKNAILHTVLVGDMNGFIYALTLGTPYENKAATFSKTIAYEKWIQP